MFYANMVCRRQEEKCKEASSNLAATHTNMSLFLFSVDLLPSLLSVLLTGLQIGQQKWDECQKFLEIYRSTKNCNCMCQGMKAIIKESHGYI